jgi:hypothetical protein
MSKSSQQGNKNSLLKRFPHLANERTYSIVNPLIKKDYLGPRNNKNQSVTKVSLQNSSSANKDLMNIEPSQGIGEGSALIHQGLSDNFKNMSIQEKMPSAQSHSAPQTALSPSSFDLTKTNDPNKTIGS